MRYTEIKYSVNIVLAIAHAQTKNETHDITSQSVDNAASENIAITKAHEEDQTRTTHH